MGVVDLFRRKPSTEVVERSSPLSLAFDDWMSVISSFSFQGVNYTLPGATQEDIGGSYSGLARGGYKGNGVVFACIANRADLFSEARFAYRRLRGGRPGDLFGFGRDHPLFGELDLLRVPWESGTTGDLLQRMLLHVDVAGNSYVVRRAGRLTPLRPDWVTLIGGVPGDGEATIWHPDARVLGYAYQEGGPALGREPEFFLADEVAHFAPRPDPEARFRGMSWLTPIVRQVMADKAMDDHKLAFFENGATPNLAVTLNVDNLEKYREWVKETRAGHEGVQNAYKTLFLAAGASAEVLGRDMEQLDFKVVQGAGETRIAAAAGVPPVIVGLSEGLAAATYSNYAQARRRFADQTMRPLWRNVAGSLARIIRVPSDAELWYDDRDIQALKEDQKDAAEIMQIEIASAVAGVNGGFTPESVVAAISGRDLTLLEHTNLLSVQLQPPGSQTPALDATPDVPVPSTNGSNGSRNGDIQLELLERMLLGSSRKRRVDFGDGRTATVRDGGVKVVDYDDGRQITITEVDE